MKKYIVLIFALIVCVMIALQYSISANFSKLGSRIEIMGIENEKKAEILKENLGYKYRVEVKGDVVTVFEGTKQFHSFSVNEIEEALKNLKEETTKEHDSGRMTSKTRFHRRMVCPNVQAIYTCYR